MRIHLAGIALVLLAAVPGACAQSLAPPSAPLDGAGVSDDIEHPYSGLQTRPIRALAPEDVEDLLAGRGAGYALAAELNHYPGPTHVLAMTSELELNQEQESLVRDVFTEMEQEALTYGRTLVALEEELDQSFRRATITGTQVEHLTSEIARVDGQLRNVHLMAHLKLKDIMTSEQVQRYDVLRGYAATETEPGPQHNMDHRLP